MIRVGHGFDVHRCVNGRPLMLGGIHIPGDVGLDGHSDADVLLHAVTDAVLGALALGDLGVWFPDSDERFRGIASVDLLRCVLRDEHLAGWRLSNLDATVLAERPKLAPHLPELRGSLAAEFGVTAGCISVKATTMEGLGAVGRGEAIAAHAVLLLESRDV